LTFVLARSLANSDLLERKLSEALGADVNVVSLGVTKEYL